VLRRNSEVVRQNYLRPLMREGRLTMTNPQEPNDPQQAHRAVEVGPQAHGDVALSTNIDRLSTKVDARPTGPESVTFWLASTRPLHLPRCEYCV
jgi:hypothetical protein